MTDVASRIENKKSRSKLGSLGGLRTAIIGAHSRAAAKGNKVWRQAGGGSQEQGRGGNHEGRPGRKGKKAEAAAFLATTQGFWETSKPIIKKYNFQLSGQRCHPAGGVGFVLWWCLQKIAPLPPCGWVGVGLCQGSSDRA